MLVARSGDAPIPTSPTRMPMVAHETNPELYAFRPNLGAKGPLTCGDAQEMGSPGVNQDSRSGSHERQRAGDLAPWAQEDGGRGP
jgi:hypothetical protein